MNIFLIGGTTVGVGDPDFARQRGILTQSMATVGRQIVTLGHNLLVCSPYPDSADLPALHGAAEVLQRKRSRKARIYYHHPNSPSAVNEWKALVGSLACPALQPFGHAAPRNELGQEQEKYGWLLAQLSALDQCHAVLAVGGKLGKSASMLLNLAIDRKVPVLPLPYLDGAAGRCYERLEKQLEQYLGPDLTDVHDPNKAEKIAPLLVRLTTKQILPPSLGKHPNFFISYPRSRPQEADRVENILWRFQHTVFRDDKDFPPGSSLPEEIKKAIHNCTVFLALWCKDYACSPWCFDEMELALQLKAAGHLEMWIFCLDETRMVPPKARPILTFPAPSRRELEGELTKLLVGHGTQKARDNER